MSAKFSLKAIEQTINTLESLKDPPPAASGTGGSGSTEQKGEKKGSGSTEKKGKKNGNGKPPPKTPTAGTPTAKKLATGGDKPKTEKKKLTPEEKRTKMMEARGAIRSGERDRSELLAPADRDPELSETGFVVKEGVSLSPSERHSRIQAGYDRPSDVTSETGFQFAPKGMGESDRKFSARTMTIQEGIENINAKLGEPGRNKDIQGESKLSLTDEIINIDSDIQANKKALAALNEIFGRSKAGVNPRTGLAELQGPAGGYGAFQQQKVSTRPSGWAEMRKDLSPQAIKFLKQFKVETEEREKETGKTGRSVSTLSGKYADFFSQLLSPRGDRPEQYDIGEVIEIYNQLKSETDEAESHRTKLLKREKILEQAKLRFEKNLAGSAPDEVADESETK